jgi:uncharacterized membrane protein
MKSKSKPATSTTGRSRLQTIFYIAAAVVALIGLAEATYLTAMYLSGETAICGGSSDCFQVLGSPYAKIGKIPLSGLGAVAYFSVFTFATFTLFGYALARKFFSWTVLAMFCMTLWLLYVQAFLLHAFCKYCLFSAALIFLLTGLVVATPAAEKN